MVNEIITSMEDNNSVVTVPSWSYREWEEHSLASNSVSQNYNKFEINWVWICLASVFLAFGGLTVFAIIKCGMLANEIFTSSDLFTKIVWGTFFTIIDGILILVPLTMMCACCVCFCEKLKIIFPCVVVEQDIELQEIRITNLSIVENRLEEELSKQVQIEQPPKK